MDIRFSKEDNKEEINNEELQVKEHQAYWIWSTDKWIKLKYNQQRSVHHSPKINPHLQKADQS